MSQAYKREETQKTKVRDAEATEDSSECPKCGATLPENADTREPCGHDSRSARCCPKCGSALPEGADICESCGEWLLPGQCKFCYAPLEEGAKFCAECGNPVDGIECPQCHNLSYFDFCKYCDIPLTEQARQAIEELRDSEEVRELVDALQNEEEPAGPSSGQAELERMTEYTERPKQPDRKQKTFTLFSKGVPSQVDAGIPRAQQGRQSRGQAARRAAPAAVERIQHRKFGSNQEARRFSGALKVLLPIVVRKKVRTPVGWLCNVYSVLHPEGPQGCGAAHGGGRWIYEEHETVETEIQEVEI